jgi:hypothetical protein
MREHLDRLAAEDDRGNAAAAVRGHDDKITVSRFRGIDDRPVGMFMLDMDYFVCNTWCLRCTRSGARSFLRVLLHACVVLSPRILEHLRVVREHMKGR